MICPQPLGNRRLAPRLVDVPAGGPAPCGANRIRHGLGSRAAPGGGSIRSTEDGSSSTAPCSQQAAPPGRRGQLAEGEARTPHLLNAERTQHVGGELLAVAAVVFRVHQSPLSVGHGGYTVSASSARIFSIARRMRPFTGPERHVEHGDPPNGRGRRSRQARSRAADRWAAPMAPLTCRAASRRSASASVSSRSEGFSCTCSS